MPVPTEPKRLRNRLYSTNVDNAFASDGRPTRQNATNASIVYRVPVEDVQRSWSGFPFRRTRDSDHDRLNRRPPGDGRVDAEIVAFDVFWRIQSLFGVRQSPLGFCANSSRSNTSRRCGLVCRSVTAMVRPCQCSSKAAILASKSGHRGDAAMGVYLGGLR
jgi:hypothetical protein